MISVIIPMYNSEEYIDECLKSVFNSSYKNYEVIVIDDGSTDQSINIVKKYKTVKLFQLRHCGPGIARNIGIEKSNGDYIFFLDSDDKINVNTLKFLVSNIENNDILIGDYNIIYDSGKKEIFKTPDDSEFNVFFESVTIWNRLYKKNFIVDNNVKFEPLFQGEDRLFLADLYLHNPKVKIIHKNVYNWLRHESSNKKTLTHIDDESNFNGQLLCMIRFKDKLINNVTISDKELLLDHLRYSCIYLNEILKKSSSDKCDIDLFEKFISSLEFEKNTKLYKTIFNKEWVIMKNDDKNIEKKLQEMQNEINKLKKESEYWSKEVEDISTLTMHKMRGPYISFEYHLADHCNLNCKGCDHFSPLAKPKLADFSEFKKDINRMSEIFEGKAKSIHILGGEPLLNKDICKFIYETRKCFPDSNLTEIRVITNGILVNDMPLDFWKSLHDNNIILSVTKYPLKLNYNQMKENAEMNNVMFEFYDNTDQEQIWYNIKLQEDGKRDAKKSFYKCFVANDCVMLKGGKLYTCTLIPNIEHFNNYFDKNLEVCKDDYIDIYKVKDKNEIFDFLAHPVPFCRYCNPDVKDYSLSWEPTKKSIDEWT